MSPAWWSDPTPFRVAAAGLVVLLGLIALMIRAAFRFRRRNDRTRAEWTRREQRWEAVLLGVLAEGRPDDDVHRLVEPADRLYFVEYLLRFARRLAGEEHQILERLAAPYLPDLAARLQQRDPEFRARAVHTLFALGPTRYGDLVAAALDDPSDLVVFVAARSLARPSGARFAPAVLARLGRLSRWRPGFLASVVAQFGPEIGPALRATLGDRGVEPGSRAIAADALRELNDLEAAGVAAAALADTADVDLLTAALGLLMEVGQPDHLAAVRPLVESPEPAVRVRAYATIARIDGPGNVALLRAALGDPSPWVAIRVIEALRAAGASGVLAELADADQVRAELALVGPA